MPLRFCLSPPRDRRRVASLHFPDCTAVALRRHGGNGGAILWGHGGDGGANAVLVRCHGGHGGGAATPLRIGPTRGGTVEVLNMLKVSAVPPLIPPSHRMCGATAVLVRH